jgi:iron complex transport system ATP-binding protein
VNSQQPYIEIKGLTIGYKRSGKTLPICSDIYLNLHSGQFIGVAGINGAGKSTFLRTIAGLQPSLSGEISVNGSSIDNLSLAMLASKVSIVLTEKIGGFNLTAYDAVAAGQMPYTNSFHRLMPQHISIIRKAIISMRLSGHEHKQLHELSDGLFQKTMIAKALAQQTPIMLLDEPSAFLDYASRHELFILLKKLCEEENKCILVSAHDLDLVLKYCGSVILFSDNKAEHISVDDALKNPAFLRLGGGFI